MKEKEFSIGKNSYTLHYLRGKVVGTDYVPSVHKKVFLKDAQEQIHTIDIKEWDIECGENNYMLFVWIIKDNNEKGDYVAVRNLTTKQTQIKNIVIDFLAKSEDNFYWSIIAFKFAIFLIVATIFSGIFYLLRKVFDFEVVSSIIVGIIGTIAIFWGSVMVFALIPVKNPKQD